MEPTQEQIETTQAITNPNEKVIELETPIMIGGSQVTHVTVRKPSVPALSGVSLQEIYTTQVDALVKVLPKVTSPQLPAVVIATMDPVDLAQLGGAVVYFLMPKSQRAVMDAQLSPA